jgi:serine/threonine-protein phosphatase 6 regulatory ankyrin repeat subunit B
MEAAWDGDTDIAKTLIGAGADLNVKQSDGWTALMIAAFSGHTGTVKILLDENADVSAQDKGDGKTALRWAVDRGHTEIVNILKQAGAKK